MFIGRSHELTRLNHIYKVNDFNFLILSGRRRIGKSSLLRKFSEDKPSIYFTALEGDEFLNLQILNNSIHTYLNTEDDSVYPSFYSALENLFKRSLDEKFILIIDEYPFLANSYPAISSILQLLIDKYKDRSKMTLILCGSSVSYMENKLIAYKAPLYGRKTGQFKLNPLSFKETIAFLKDMTNEEKVVLYGIFGGTPYYLSKVNLKKNLKENIIDNYLINDSFLADEPQNLLRQEVRELSTYYTILSVIANGATRLSEIASKIHMETSACAKYINTLIEIGLVVKESPYKNKATNRSLYKLNENAFNFWFKFVQPNQSLIAKNYAERAYLKIEPQLSTYIGPVFEDICAEYLWELLVTDESPVDFDSLGRWWGTNPNTKSQVKIDIMGYGDQITALFAECKWTNEKVGSKVLKDLVEKSMIFPHLIKHYYIFSKSGFTQGLIELTKEIPNVHLIDLDEIIDTLKNSN